MSNDQSTEAFYRWASSLHCPHEKRPDRQALRMLLGKDIILMQIMDKVKPMQEVKCMRDQMLAQKIKIFNEKKITEPSLVKKYNKMQNLKASIEKSRLKVTNVKKLVNTLKDNIVATQSERLSKAKECNVEKNILLQLRLMQMEEKILQEEKINESLKEAFPVNSSLTNANAQQKVTQCIDKMNEYYSKCEASGENINLKEVWEEVKQHLNPVQKSFLYEYSINMQEKAHQTLRDVCINFILDVDVTNDQHEKLYSIERAIAKINCEELKELIRLRALTFKNSTLKEDSDEALNKILSSVQNSLTEEDYDLASKLVFEIARKCCSQEKYKMLVKKLETLQNTNLKFAAEIEAQPNIVFSQTYDSYIESDGLIKKLHNKVRQLNQISKRIYFTLNSINETINSHFELFSKSFLNISTISNLSMLSAKSSSSNDRESYERELLNFVDYQIILNLHKSLMYTERFWLGKYCTINNSSLMTNITFPFTNLEGLHHNLQLLQKFLEQINNFNKPIANKISIEDCMDSIMTNEEQHTDTVIEKLNILKTTIRLNNDELKRLEMLLDFLIENPLRKYIRSRIFNGRMYSEYENEYLRHFNTINKQK